MFEDEWDDEDEIKGTFQTKDEKKREQNAKSQRNFRRNHKVKQFCVNFTETDGLDEIMARLRQDGVTNKEFIIRSFKRYERDGGFGED